MVFGASPCFKTFWLPPRFSLGTFDRACVAHCIVGLPSSFWFFFGFSVPKDLFIPPLCLGVLSLGQPGFPFWLFFFSRTPNYRVVDGVYSPWGFPPPPQGGWTLVSYLLLGYVSKRVFLVPTPVFGGRGFSFAFPTPTFCLFVGDYFGTFFVNRSLSNQTGLENFSLVCPLWGFTKTQKL